MNEMMRMSLNERRIYMKRRVGYLVERERERMEVEAGMSSDESCESRKNEGVTITWRDAQMRGV